MLMVTIILKTKRRCVKIVNNKFIIVDVILIHMKENIIMEPQI